MAVSTDPINQKLLAKAKEMAKAEMVTLFENLSKSLPKGMNNIEFMSNHTSERRYAARPSSYGVLMSLREEAIRARTEEIHQELIERLINAVDTIDELANQVSTIERG